jgi:hypothetical protein
MRSPKKRLFSKLSTVPAVAMLAASFAPALLAVTDGRLDGDAHSAVY